MHQCAYLLENVPPLGNFWLNILARWKQIRAWINKPMQVDDVSVGSRIHQFWWIWTNITPLEVIQ
jgi:hypothetical protein